MTRADKIMMDITGNIQIQPIIEWEKASEMVQQLLDYHIAMRSFIEVYKRTCEIALDTEGTLYKAACKILEDKDEIEKEISIEA